MVARAWGLALLLLVNSDKVAAQDTLVVYSETGYTFKAPSSWKRDNRGVEPLFYLPDSTGQADRANYFSILRESLDEGEELRSFVDDHFQLSQNLWKKYGSEISLLSDTTVMLESVPFIRQTMFLTEFGQYKVQWFIKSGNTALIFELTAKEDSLIPLAVLAEGVVGSLRIVER